MSKDIRHQLGQRIRELRAKQKLTQSELADRADISVKFLQNLESKAPKKATIVTLQKISAGFKITPSDLLKF